MENKYKFLTSNQLKILAMIFMLCDHLSVTLLPQMNVLGYIGRLAFPIFAFQVAEGYARTKNFKKYFGRMFLLALLSEIPFDLMAAGTLFYPFHQNVIFTFCMALLLLRFLDLFKAKSVFLRILILLAVLMVGYLIGFVTMVDYFGYGIWMVIGFYVFKDVPKGWLAQLCMMAYINIEMMGGEYILVDILGHQLEIVVQGLSLLALIPIWLYSGRQGSHSKIIRFVCYAFYPVHMFIIACLWLYAV